VPKTNRAAKAAAHAPRQPGTPKAARQLPYDRSKDHPYFCFKHVDTSTSERYKFVLSEAEAKEILDFACKMSQQSWLDIEQMSTGRKKRSPLHHDHPVENIETCAQNDLIRRHLDETLGDRPLFRFRLGGEKRLWGFRSGQVFHAIWFDREHDVYEQDKNKPRRARKERRKKRK
jgi:hypothetical protein